MEENKPKPVYTEKTCEICNKKYLSNYYYQHRNTQKHKIKEKSKEIKNELLKEDKKETKSNIDLIDEVITYLGAIKHNLLNEKI